MSNAGPFYVPPLDPMFADTIDSAVEQVFDSSFMEGLDPSFAPQHYPSAGNPKPDVWDIFEEFFGKQADAEFAPVTPEAIARPAVPLLSATSQPTSIQPLPNISALTTASTAQVINQPESHPPQSTPIFHAPQADQNLILRQSVSEKFPSKKTKPEKICQEIEDIDHQLESLKKDIQDAKKTEDNELSSCFAEHNLTEPPSADDKSKIAKTAQRRIKKVKNKFSARISRINTKIENLRKDQLLLKKELKILKLKQQVSELQAENEQLRALQGDPVPPQQTAILWLASSAITKPVQEPEPTATIASKRSELK